MATPIMHTFHTIEDAIILCGVDDTIAFNGATKAERIADEYERRDLLKFGAREDNLTDPKCVVGES